MRGDLSFKSHTSGFYEKYVLRKYKDFAGMLILKLFIKGSKEDFGQLNLRCFLKSLTKAFL